MNTNTMDLLYNEFLTANENKRIEIYRRLASVYDYDAFEVEKIIKRMFLNKPFSEATLNKIVFIHENVLSKIIERKCSGLFSKEILISLINKDGTEIYINDWLNNYEFFLHLFDIYKRSKFFNTVLSYINVIDNEIIFESITGAECVVNTKTNFYKPKEIFLFRSDEDKRAFILYWSENEVYKIYGTNKYYLEAFPDGINYLGFMPFSVYRDNKQIDFWGEPNWSLYYHQLIYVLNKSDNVYGEFFVKFPILFGENVVMPENMRIEPSVFISAENKLPDTKVDIRFINPNVDWASIRENEKYRNEQIAINEGLPASSVSVKAIQQSGYAKTIDEIELRERQMVDEWKLYYFIKDLVMKTLKVAYYFNLLPKNVNVDEIVDVDVKFNPTKSYEEPSQIKIRREMEKEFMIKDEIDFIMEDLGLTEEEAIKYLQKRLERQDLINEYKNKLSVESNEEQNSLSLVERLKSLL